MYKCDATEQIKQFDKGSVDITITSPPYGDNHTTVPYGLFSILTLYWIDKNDLVLEGWEFENYSIIDSKSLGGCKSNNNIYNQDLQLIQPYLNNIAVNKQIKVKKFFSNYFEILGDICRVTDKYIVLTLGNRTVDGVKINLNDITKNFLEKNNFKLNWVDKRGIYNKRMPKLTSNVRNNPVESMNSEFIAIYSKNI